VVGVVGGQLDGWVSGGRRVRGVGLAGKAGHGDDQSPSGESFDHGAFPFIILRVIRPLHRGARRAVLPGFNQANPLCLATGSPRYYHAIIALASKSPAASELTGQTLAMAILEILEFPDPRLRTIAKPVEQVDDALRQVIADMFETMYAAPGIGLAATQVNIHKRLLVMDISDDKNEPLVFINPAFEPVSGSQEYDEGCLSVPGYFDTVTRHARIRVTALDRMGPALRAGG
jgi:peptide deformylase